MRRKIPNSGGGDLDSNSLVPDLVRLSIWPNLDPNGYQQTTNEIQTRYFQGSGPYEPWPRGYKTFFMLNSTEHKISTVHKH